MALDKTPFIWINHQKVYPINKAQGPMVRSKQNDAPPFGIVDRVTISRQARYMYEKAVRTGLIQAPTTRSSETRDSGKRGNRIIEYTVKTRY